MNRISQFMEESPDEDHGDFFIIAGPFGAVSVTNETAARIDEVLDRESVPEWVVFDDAPDRAFGYARVRSARSSSPPLHNGRQTGASTGRVSAKSRKIDVPGKGTTDRQDPRSSVVEHAPMPRR